MRLFNTVRNLVLVVAGVYCLVLLGCAVTQRSMLYYPSHHGESGRLSRWTLKGALIGYAREVPSPRTVWFLLHGNAGQAEDRAYALHCFPDTDSVFVLEYPGYGSQSGHPSKDNFNAAAAIGYQLLRATFPNTPVCVAGESIGSGPACFLASQPVPPDKIALVVPFDTLASVASEHLPYLPVRWLLRDNWDNTAALSAYRGPVEIFGAQNDTVIPVRHAKHLADSHPGAVFHLIPGGHNDWSSGGEVRFVR